MYDNKIIFILLIPTLEIFSFFFFPTIPPFLVSGRKYLEVI